jgi:hypothetical protein
MKRRGNVISPVDSISSTVEMLIQTDSSVEDGEIVWVRSEQCLYVFRQNSGLIPNGTTIVGSLYGNGVWVQLPGTSSAGVMSQLTWFIDSVNGNDANSGQTAATALKTDAERQRRMGTTPFWNAGAYHLRYLNDVGVNDTVVLAGTRASNSQIFVHGSAVDHQGKATLFSGTIDLLTAQNPATNTPWQITSNAIPVTWVASGLIGQRLRLTSGAATGAISFPIKDLAAKKARFCEFRGAVSYVVPVNPSQLIATATPALTNTFVVESLVAIPTLLITLQAADNFTVNAGSPVIFDSVQIGSGDFTMDGADAIDFDGCIMTLFENAAFILGTILSGCRLTISATISGPSFMSLVAGYSDTLVTGSPSAQVIVLSNFMVQGAQFVVPGHAAWLHGAVFDSPSSGIGLFENGTFHASTQSGTLACWGSGNAGVGLEIKANYANYVSGSLAGFTITGTGGDFSIGGLTSISAYDQAARVYTATRTTSWANMAATVAGGGFGGQVVDPISGGKLVLS